ncbi:MAG: hypothetical protein FJ098_06270 [Deltaproteobacteria bacterium]|nr:hypothetical protein [Deltaproteobacteria bacterium]
MKITALILPFLLAACGELVTPGIHPSNRTLGPGGGSVSLDRFTATVPPEVLAGSLTLRIEEADDAALPDGGLGPAYRLLPGDFPAPLAAAGLPVSYRMDPEELPEDLVYVDLAVARLDGDRWEPLAAAAWDPLAGEVTGRSPAGGVFTLVHAPPDLP